MKIVNVVGARPNFIKMAPIVEALNRHPNRFEHRLVHTGQHYDERMSASFFKTLSVPRPDIDLGIGSGTHAQQTARVMTAFEQVCLNEKPDLVTVVGDVNSTMACTITAKKLGIAVAHVEAGLRSRDMSMPEEINRLCTDVLCDYLFTTDRFASENLRREGIAEHKIHFVGNVMIDTLLKHKCEADTLNLMQELGLEKGRYATLTMHRPSNVDDRATLTGIVDALAEVAEEMPIVFPAHPRTRKMLETYDLLSRFQSSGKPRRLWLSEPLGYVEFLHLNINARMVLTDSGGLQEETTALGIPCITLRYNTERPITCSEGTNRLAGSTRSGILDAVAATLKISTWPEKRPEKWDGKAAERIVSILLQSA